MKVKQQGGAPRDVDFLNRVLFCLDVGLQSFDVGRRDAGDEVTQHLAFDHPAHGKHLARFGDRRLGDKGAPGGLLRDQFDLLQFEQGLAHQSARHPEAVANGLFYQFGAGFQAVFDDGLCDGLHDLLRDRCVITMGCGFCL